MAVLNSAKPSEIVTLPAGAEIEFSLEFEFRSLILQHTVRMLFAEAVKRMVSAFEARAAQLYRDNA